MPAKHITVTGKVQGVFFRAEAKERADNLGVKGWVKNSPDGSIEIHAEGSPDALMEFEQWCTHGPEMARVDAIQSQEVPEEGFDTFEVAR